MKKVVKIGDRELGLKATALTPRIYRFQFGRDMVVDMNQLKKNFAKAVKAKQEDETEEDAQLSALDLTIFENVAFIMAKQYDPSLPDTPEQWLDEQDTVFTVYQLLPYILELWQANQSTTAIPKKN